MVPNVPLTPDAVAGPFTGGQFCAHTPLHFDTVEVSGANEYSVNPLAVVSTVAPPIVVVFRLLAVAAAGLLLLLDDEEGVADGVLDELHPAATAAAAAATGRASSIRRRRSRARGRASVLIMFLLCGLDGAGCPRRMTLRRP
jgi:hypothetical protein